MTRAHGIDISRYQESFDASVNPVDIQFVIIRASYGIQTDAFFEPFYNQIQSIPVRGAYHYLRSSIEWKDQADHFLSLVEGKNFHFYALDIESAFNTQGPKFAKDARRWLEGVSRRTNKKLVLYTNIAVYQNWLAPYGNWMPKWPLWLAQYYHEPDRNKTPSLPKNVTEWTFWQYSADGNKKGAQYGVKSRDIDLDVFNGSVAELHKWAGVSITPAPEKVVEVETIKKTDQEIERLARKLAPMVAEILRGTPGFSAPVSFGGQSFSFSGPEFQAVPEVDAVNGIGQIYARRLRAVGIPTVRELASSEPEDLTDALGISVSRAREFIEQAGKLMGA